tara:strand:+ start:2087 stop:2710 length:624 start_codon:yes stop_codon:yes gene_type:complete
MKLINKAHNLIIIKIFLSALILIFSFQSWTKADDISDFEIEGMSIGDSLLEYFNLSEIKEAEDNVSYYQKSNKYKIIWFYSKTRELFDYINITLKDNDKKYIIYGIRGEKEISLDKCYKMKAEQVKGIESILSYIDKSEYKSGYAKIYGNSKSHVTQFSFKDGSQIRIWCADYDDKNENVIKSLWKDGLEVSLASKELVYFLTHEAY